VIAVAKKDLAIGDLIEDFGGYQVYGVAENMDAVRQGRHLPIGLGLGCTLARPVAKDAALTLDDVLVPADRTVDSLYAEQERCFAPLSEPLRNRS
jgi:predicted homoserine dehydrogenase-like protein